MIRRTYSYVVFGLGIVASVAGALKLLPGGIALGAALIFLGLALFGLSFVQQPEPGPDAPPPMPFFERLTGMFFEPSRVFSNLRARPRWVAALAVIVLLNFVYATAFNYRLTPERIVDFTTDKVAESFNIPAGQSAAIKADQIEALKSPAQVAGGAVTQFAGAFFVMCLLSGLCLLAVLIMGGRISFWQAFSVFVHAALPAVIIERTLSLIILFIKNPDDIHPVLGQQGLVTDNLGALFSPAENPVLFSVASFVGVLAFYRVWLTATGLRHGGERISPGTAWGIAIAFWAIGLVLVSVMALLFPQFIS